MSELSLRGWIHKKLPAQTVYLAVLKTCAQVVDSVWSIMDTALSKAFTWGIVSRSWYLSSRIPTIWALTPSHCYYRDTEGWSLTPSGSGPTTFQQLSASWTNLHNPNPSSTIEHKELPLSLLRYLYSHYTFALMSYFFAQSSFFSNLIYKFCKFTYDLFMCVCLSLRAYDAAASKVCHSTSTSL